ncbi:MAG: proton-conducting transporter membrane subunit, partial [Pseudomonadota bacterium]
PNSLYAGMFIAVGTFLLTLVALAGFSIDTPAYQFIEDIYWFELPSLAHNGEDRLIRYTLGVDAISLSLMIVVAGFTLASLVGSLDDPRARVGKYVGLILLSESLMLGALASMDTFLFVVFYGACAIPLCFLIGIWGREARARAASAWLLSDLLATGVIAVSVLYLFANAGSQTVEVTEVTRRLLPVEPAYIGGLLSICFALRAPLPPFHRWSIFAQQQAPKAGFILVSALLPCLSVYGFIRLAAPMLPAQSTLFLTTVLSGILAAGVYCFVKVIDSADYRGRLPWISALHIQLAILYAFIFAETGRAGVVILLVVHAFCLCGLILLSEPAATAVDTADRPAVLARRHRVVTVLLSIIFLMGVCTLPPTIGFAVVKSGFSASNSPLIHIVGIGMLIGLNLLGAIYVILDARRAAVDHSGSRRSSVATLHLPFLLCVLFASLSLFPESLMRFLGQAALIPSISSFGNG